MKKKRFIDFTYDEMCFEVLEREPSLEELRKKGLILLRGAIVALGRIEVVFDVMSKEGSAEFFRESRENMIRVANITSWLNNLDFFSKKETQTANLGSGENLSNEQDFHNETYQK